MTAGDGRDEQLLARAPQPGRGGVTQRPHGGHVAALPRDGIHERTPAADLDGAHLDEVTRQRGLGDLGALAEQEVGELALAVHLVLAEQLDDAALALGAAHALASRAAAEDGGQRVEEAAQLLVGDDERRREPDRRRGDGVDDEAGLPGRGHDRRGRYAVELDRAQQSSPAGAGDAVDRHVVEQRADLADVGQQVVALDRVEHGETRRAGERVAAERRAVLARHQQSGHVGAEGHEGADGHAAAEALGERHRVGHDARPLVGEPVARAADAGLDLVDDEQRAVSGRQLTGEPEVVVGELPHPRLALDRLDDERPPSCRPPRRAARRRRRAPRRRPRG